MNPMLRKVIATNPSFGPFVARLTLAAVMFPHGAQKVLGWFGGYGLTGTLKYFTDSLHIPAPLALLAFAAEFLGPLLLLLGAFSRIAALAVAVTMVVAIKFHLQNGFFMNWSANQPGEGIEYHLLVIGLAFVVLVEGGGRYSVDGSCAIPAGPRSRD